MTRWARRFLAGVLLAILAAKLGRRAEAPSSESRAPRPHGSSLPPAKAPAGTASTAPASVPSVDRSASASSPWASPSSCLRAVLAGARLPRAAGVARFVTWNIRWFPDGGPGKVASEHPTNLEWLACALTYLNADVFALQELKAYPGARQKLERVRARLDELSHRRYQTRLDDCDPPAAQHVALMWDANRVKSSDFEVVAELNPHGGPCQGHLRPGLGARVRFPNGLDLQVVTAHLKSGSDEDAMRLRERSVERLPALLELVTRQHRDGDLLVLGDFNTAGCSSCSPSQSGESERAELAALLAKAATPWSLLPNEPGCSHYFSRRAGLLDLVLAPRSMRELGSNPSVHASGLCAEFSCGPLPRALPAAYQELSDHCPVVADLLDRDLD